MFMVLFIVLFIVHMCPQLHCWWPKTPVGPKASYPSAFPFSQAQGAETQDAIMERELKKAAMVVVWMWFLEAISYIHLH